MSVIALAGGTGGFGRTLLKELELVGEHKIFVLSRSAINKTKSLTTFVQVDYNDVDGLVKFLVDNSVDTVVSSIYIMDYTSSQAQLNLIRAAAMTKGTTRRFIASEYNMIIDETTAALNPSFQLLVDNADALRKTQLQWTRVANGYFMDYWGMPHIPTTLQPGIWAIDVEKGVAAIPGNGDDLLTLTYSVDVAKAVVRILGLAEWPEYCIVSGDDVSFNQLLGVAEKYRGKKFQVSYDAPEELRKGECTMLTNDHAGSGWSDEEMKAGTAWFGTILMDGHLLMPKEPRLNDLVPGLQMTSLDKLMDKAWSGKH